MSKICRLCWKILDDNVKSCDDKHMPCDIFFLSVKDLIDTLVNKKVRSALKLEQLVEEKLYKLKNHTFTADDVSADQYKLRTVTLLQSLLDKSMNSKQTSQKL